MPDSMSASATNQAASRRFFEEAFSQGKLEVLDEIASPDYQDHDPQNPFAETRGPQGARDLISMYRKAFPDVKMTVEEVIAEGDNVVVRWSARGTHSGELMGMAPTGKQVEVSGITIDRYVDGKSVEGWTNWDTLGLMQQIGAAPARGSVGEKVGIQVQRLTARRFRRKAGTPS